MATPNTRLNQPRETGGWRPHLKLDADAFGNFAEKFARWMGTAQFIGYMTVFVVAWIVLNVVGIYGYAWDPYPFILLNLFFSTQASYSAPLILLAQNRQEDRDRVMVETDRQQAAQSRADMDYLAREIAGLRMRVNDMPTRDFIRGELRDLLEELDARDARPDEPR